MNSMKLSKRFKWIEITKIEGISDYNVVINFGKLGKFCVHLIGKKNKLFTKILSYIYSYSLESDMPEIVFPKKYASKNLQESYKPSLVAHMKMKMREKGHILSKSAINEMYHFFIKEPSQIRLNQFREIVDYMPYCLEVLHWFPYVKKIIVPFNSSFGAQDPIKLLSNYVPNNPNINDIVFKGEMPFHFSKFIKKMVKSNKTIENVAFDSCNFNIKQILALAVWIKTSTIKVLALEKSLSPIVTHNFVLSLENNSGAASLNELILNRTASIDVTLLISFLPNLKKIVLQNCDFELNDFLNGLNSLQNCLLQTAILSGCHCNRRLQQKIQFPSFLYEIDVSNIYWERESFYFFFNSLIHHNPVKFNQVDGSADPNISNNDRMLIKLDISNAKLKADQWIEFFRKVQSKIGPNLGSLKWNSNPLHKAFFLFLEKCQELSEISLDGCFNQNGEELDPLLSFCSDFLKENYKIRSFSCAGTSRKWLGSKGTREIIECLSYNSWIHNFDISNNRAGSESIIALAKILSKNRSIESVNIRGNNIVKFDDFRLFFEILGSRGKPLYVQWPEDELNDMLQFGTAKKKDVESLKLAHEKLSNGEKYVRAQNISSMINVNKNNFMKVHIKTEPNITLPAADDVL